MVLSLVQLACSGYSIIQLDFPHLSLSLGTIQNATLGFIGMISVLAEVLLESMVCSLPYSIPSSINPTMALSLLNRFFPVLIFLEIVLLSFSPLVN